MSQNREMRVILWGIISSRNMSELSGWASLIYVGFSETGRLIQSLSCNRLPRCFPGLPGGKGDGRPPRDPELSAHWRPHTAQINHVKKLNHFALPVTFWYLFASALRLQPSSQGRSHYQNCPLTAAWKITSILPGRTFGAVQWGRLLPAQTCSHSPTSGQGTSPNSTRHGLVSASVLPLAAAPAEGPNLPAHNPPGKLRGAGETRL